jgi:peptide/nickel transport system permease protein
MTAFILRRLLYIIPVLAGVLALTLVLFFVVAEDPVLAYAGQNPTAEQLRALRKKYSLDVPAFLDFGWLRGNDILEVKRRTRLEAAVDRIDELVNAEEVDVETVDRFKRAWKRGVTLKGRAETINEQLEQLAPGHDLRVDFEGVALSIAEIEEVEARSIFDAQFFRVARFDFDESMQYEESIWALIARKLPITLSVTLPMFFIGLAIELALALFAASRRGRPADTIVTVLAILAMSVPFLSYIVFGQWLAAETQIFPVSGWAPGLAGVKYLAFPILIGVIAGLGSAIRFYRAVFLEEMEQDYVRTARAKGVSGTDILFIHVLRNAGIPIITRLSVVIPFLITGSLLIERLFELPGLGDLMLSGIQARDFWVVMPLTYLLAVVYSLTVLATDIAYAFIDPRVRVH